MNTLLAFNSSLLSLDSVIAFTIVALETAFVAYGIFLLNKELTSVSTIPTIGGIQKRANRKANFDKVKFFKVESPSKKLIKFEIFSLRTIMKLNNFTKNINNFLVSLLSQNKFTSSRKINIKNDFIHVNKSSLRKQRVNAR